MIEPEAADRGFFGLGQVAGPLGITQDEAAELCRTGALKAELFEGRLWCIDPESFYGYADFVGADLSRYPGMRS
jgi:hypothetical protein